MFQNVIVRMHTIVSTVNLKYICASCFRCFFFVFFLVGGGGGGVVLYFSENHKSIRQEFKLYLDKLNHKSSPHMV